MHSENFKWQKRYIVKSSCTHISPWFPSPEMASYYQSLLLLFSVLFRKYRTGLYTKLTFKNMFSDFWPRWRYRYIHFASSHNQKKDKKFKTINNQNFQKIELYGSPTTKELKKKHSFRLVGGAEMGSWGRRGQVVRGRLEDRVVPHLLKINWEKQVGRETDHATQGSSVGQ